MRYVMWTWLAALSSGRDRDHSLLHPARSNAEGMSGLLVRGAETVHVLSSVWYRNATDLLELWAQCGARLGQLPVLRNQAAV